MSLRIGTCGWTDQTLLACGRFYPAEITRDPEKRLTFYTKHFNTVEVDSTYYHLPAERNSRLWSERTNDDFVFNLKAYKTLTLHDKNNSPTQLEWSMFKQALRPLYDSNKLGYILFQFPPWFNRSNDNMRYILSCRNKMPDYQLVFQFRHGSWMWPPYRGKTINFMRTNNLVYVCVDEPQYQSKATIPPLALSTNRFLSVIRFNGRNNANWFKKNIPVYERFHYRYSNDELKQWVQKVNLLHQQTKDVYVMFNNCFEDDAIVNARQMAQLLESVL